VKRKPYMPGCVVCEERRASKRVALGFGLAAVAVVLLLATQAHAQSMGAPLGSPISDPCAPGAYDPDAGVVLMQPTDGGAADPVVICQGQRAPASGTFLAVDTAARIAGKLAGDKQAIGELESELVAEQAAPPSSVSTKTAVIIGAVVFVLGAAAGAYVAHEVK